MLLWFYKENKDFFIGFQHSSLECLYFVMIGKHDELEKLRQGYELENTSLHKKIISDHFLMKKNNLDNNDHVQCAFK